MALFLVKVLIAPSFVVCASLAGRRFGSRIGGLIAGLPVVAGPILLVYALEHGSSFAANAAVGTLLGLVSLIAFGVIYARAANRASWGASLLAGWFAFALATVIFSAVTVSAGVALAVALAGLAIGLAVLPRPHPEPTEHGAMPGWDLPMRAGCALALVLSLTAIAGSLGPQLSGLLAPFPIIATVLAIFTHAQRGSDEVQRMLRWLLSGYGAFAFFCFTLAVTLRAHGVGAAFALATAVALLTQSLLLIVMARAGIVGSAAIE